MQLDSSAVKGQSLCPSLPKSSGQRQDLGSFYHKDVYAQVPRTGLAQSYPAL